MILAWARSVMPRAACKQAGGFGHIVDIVGLAGDMLVGGIVRAGRA